MFHIFIYTYVFLSIAAKTGFSKKMLSLHWIYHIHEGKNCLQDTNFASLYQMCFLTWACILAFSTISFFQNMECLGRSTCMLISNIILETRNSSYWCFKYTSTARWKVASKTIICRDIGIARSVHVMFSLFCLVLLIDVLSITQTSRQLISIRTTFIPCCLALRIIITVFTCCP